jgi:tetratricopeptide (TPR) repeat protein
VQIFQKLATKDGPNSDVAKTLLFLWGPRLTDKQADWITDRISHTSGKTRLAWLDIASNTFAPQRAEKLLGDYASQYADNDAFNDRLIATYQEAGNRAALLGLLDDQRKRATHDPARLKTLMVASQASNFEDLTQQIAQRLTVIDKSGPEPFRIMGQLAFGKEQFDTARAYLERYLALKPAGDYETYYELAESYDRLGRQKTATQNYRKALDLLKQQPNPTFDMRHLEGLLLQRLQRYDDAVAIFTRLLRDRPGDAGVIADIAETRLLQKSPQRALQRVRQQ